MTLFAGDDDAMAGDYELGPATVRESATVAKATRLHDLLKLRERHFRRAVMGDSAMAIMLSLFLGELKAIPLTSATLCLVNLLEASDCEAMLETLIQAGLAVVTEQSSERRTVGLTPLGSARMRSYVNDLPDA